MSVEFEHKVIYCKQFPHQDIDKLLEEQEVSGEKFSSMPRESPEAFRQRIEQSSTYILRADKAQKKEAFINLAKSLSAGYEIDMKIEEYGYFVSVTMYMDCATYTGEVKKMLTELTIMSENISFFLSSTDPCDFILSLDYFTHDHYVSGRKVDY